MRAHERTNERSAFRATSGFLSPHRDGARALRAAPVILEFDPFAIRLGRESVRDRGRARARANSCVRLDLYVSSVCNAIRA